MESRFSLRWNNYSRQISEAFSSLLLEEDLVDVTLSCEGKKIKAHKILLSACSPYFHEIFKENPCQHPVIVFKNVNLADLMAIIEFIYNGEVNVLQDQLESFLKTAAILEVKGLTNNENDIEEFSEPVMIDGENLQTSPVGKQQIISEEIYYIDADSEISAIKSPPAKKRKTNIEENSDGRNISTEEVTIKNEIEEIDICYEKNIKSETPGSKILPQQRVPTSSKDNAKTHEQLSTENIKVRVDDENSTQETTSPDLEPKDNPHLKKHKIPEEEILSEAEVPPKSGNKTPDAKNASALVTKLSENPKIKAKVKVQLPKDLMVIPMKDASQVKDLFDYPAQQLQAETYQAVRSEDATTPIHEEPLSYPQDTPGEDARLQNDSEVEPEIAEEAPLLQEQTELGNSVEDEHKGLEFDYFGCETCKSEAKPVDLDRITFNHKCPICPCCCFCVHLLKDHMKVIHGWFNVQRRFTHY